MQASKWTRILVILTGVVGLVGSVGAWRFYRTAPELRLPTQEIYWQVLPYVGLVFLSVALISLIWSRDN